MSNVVDLAKYKSREELEKFARIQFEQVLKLRKELDDANSKLSHAESLMLSSPTVLNVGSPEEELCKIEINRLYQDAKRAPLEWDQTRAFEVYVKALLAIKGKTTPEGKAKSEASNLSQDELIKLALQATNDSSEQ